MKKLLALVLALVMTLSLCVVSSNAAYAGEEFDYEEAVEVMSAVGVFQGDENGKFNPTGILTREQAAKIVTYMLLGKKAADALVTIAAPFADVAADRWSAGSIAYCYNEGILAGVGNGMFAPTSELTGLAFAKMMLTALGYDAEVEGLVGSNWSINAAKLALTVGLTEDMDDVSLSDPMTREQAAQMAFNTMLATMVEYKDQSTITAGNVTIKTQAAATKVAAPTTSNRYSWLGTTYAGYVTNTNGNDAYLQFCENYFGDLKLTVTEDDFGRDADKWAYKKDSVGTFAVAADETYTGKVTKGTLYDLVGKDVYDDLDDNEATLSVVVDGKPVSTPTLANYIAKNSTAAAGVSGNSVQTEVFVSSNHNVKIVMINTYAAVASGDYSVKNEQLKINEVEVCKTTEGLTSKVLSAEDFDVADYKDGDYLTYTAAWDNTASKYEIQSIAPAEVVSGNVEGYKAGDSVTIDGTTYKYNKAVSSDSTNGNGVSYSVGKLAKVVVDGFGNVVYVKDKTAASDLWVFIEEVAKANGLGSKYVASAIFPDGTEEVISVKKVNDNDPVASAVPGWYTYTKSGESYKLDNTGSLDLNVSTADSEGKYVLVENGKTAFGQSSTAKANAATTFIVKDADDVVTVYTGISKVPTITAKTGAGNVLTAYYVETSATNHAAKYVFVDTGAAKSVVDAGSSSTDYIYLLKKTGTYTTVDNDVYYTYDALVEGEKVEIKVDDECSVALNTLYYKGKQNDDGWYTSMADATAKNNVDDMVTLTDATFGYADGVLTVDKDYVLAEDYTIYFVTTAAALKDDDGVTYEFDEETASSLKNLMAGLKAVAGSDANGGTSKASTMFVERVDSDDTAVKALYIFVAGTAEVPAT